MGKAALRNFVSEVLCRIVKELPRRWLVERTFGWMTRWRRLGCDYEKRSGAS